MHIHDARPSNRRHHRVVLYHEPGTNYAQCKVLAASTDGAVPTEGDGEPAADAEPEDSALLPATPSDLPQIFSDQISAVSLVESDQYSDDSVSVTLSKDGDPQVTRFRISLADASSERCLDRFLLTTGFAYGAFERGAGPIEVVGIVPDDATTVQIAGKSVAVHNNVWHYTGQPGRRPQLHCQLSGRHGQGGSPIDRVLRTVDRRWHSNLVAIAVERMRSSVITATAPAVRSSAKSSRCSRARSNWLPGRLRVDVELHQLHGSVWRQLSNYRETSDNVARCDQDAVLRHIRKQPREVIPPDGEALDDSQQVEHLEVIRGWFTIRTALGWQLAIEIREAPWGRPNRSPRSGH